MGKNSKEKRDNMEHRLTGKRNTSGFGHSYTSSKHKQSAHCLHKEYSSFSHKKYSTSSDRGSKVHKKPKFENAVESSNIQLETVTPARYNEAFSWEAHRVTLNRMFFTDTDTIKRGMSEYDDFWNFLKKYQAVPRKPPVRMQFDHEDSDVVVPSPYNCQFKINFTFKTGNIEVIMHRGYLFKDDNDFSSLSEDRVAEFQYILLLYLNFLQKQKFTRLVKLRDSQTNLPISQYRSKIVEAVNCQQVVIVAGDTGCGKSTQVPQYLLAAGYNSIACCQPRRIACIALSKRVAYETLNEYGPEVGYQIRFEKRKTRHTKIVFLTEGLLLRQVMTDPMLSAYKVIILDEVHERHLPCDFLLGIVKCLVHQRPDIKIILMSATINIQLFADYFNKCPIIQVPGRLFPIQVEYWPVSMEDKLTKTSRLNPAPYIRVMQQIDHKIASSERGDLLIFLSGTAEISTVEEAARLYAQQTQKWIILPLHSMLSLEEQDKVFHLAPERVRKCVISTNIAETSITIDGIRFVVDSGKVKEMSYDSTCRMQRLQEFWISRASAEQRKGRAGRTGPGICYRLFSEAEFESLIPYSTPEIQRVPIDSLLLQMISMGLPDARKFPFLEPPPLIKVEESLQSLKDQGALTEDESLTPMGQMLSRLPVDVIFGKMLIMGSLFNLTEPILMLAAAMSIQSPFITRSYRDVEALSAQRSLMTDHGDPFSLLNAYNSWLEVKADSHNNSRKWCRRHRLEEQRFYEMTKLRKQFKELMKVSGLMKFKSEDFSSNERIKRHGELKQLQEMKRKFHQLPHQRKFLRLETEVEGIAHSDSDVEDVDDNFDIYDVEFRMSLDRAQAKELSSSSQEHVQKNLTLLKIILCNGLYPQFAFPDEHNSRKSDCEQFYHTKGKPFVVLHPNSVLSLEPESLRLNEIDIHVVPNFTSHLVLSTKHQLLAYVSLLETTKPYLVNCLRVPAAHVLLLVAHSLDTNKDFTRIVVDGWLELMLPNEDEAQHFVSRAMCVRDLWQEVLQRIFQESELKGSKGKEFSPETRRRMNQLYNSMQQFLHIECLCSFRRLLAADKKHLYIGKQEGNMLKFPLENVSGSHDPLLTQSSVKGGFQVKDYMTYNCLQTSEQSPLQYIQKHWKCPDCNQEMLVTVLQKVRHQEQCSVKTGQNLNEEALQSGNIQKKPYFCISCQKEFVFSSTEVLRHKRTHLPLNVSK